MCRIFAEQPPESYACETRSLRIGGHCTSLRLEAAFWTILEEIARQESLSVAKFATKLHDEVLERQGEVRNFASLLRCCCLTYLAQQGEAGRSSRPALMAAE
ncbi:ribbon-helix-helix domain-containing protein [Methylobacterium isbiliense]|jgi:predicted DNA-binding ribbon-helix-helix protein|uniref:Ribbon-helix-helix domain-containing protein n=1 Tax=Methylobacterium isbiliense TaxID=315478 RepID=A0ABQ4SFE4_9HYPH|nr:ribbon-helix-helix domain-containing protein [Methylobacterium isbiliense]MDN3625081.1 ribbon-helix-helix domain-containing protein [Methylobacterium isbiliense]GJE00489.1 hypothetical protein GMJLKIPL_2411 [Methylobacterium isbiliense]